MFPGTCFRPNPVEVLLWDLTPTLTPSPTLALTPTQSDAASHHLFQSEGDPVLALVQLIPYLADPFACRAHPQPALTLT